MLRPIILTGFMCSGKTTVAAALGTAMNRRVVDLDTRITSASGKTPRQIIANEGEAAFRELETQMLEEVLREGLAEVIALGGGAWIRERNRHLIELYGGVTVWLDAPFEVCWQRIVKDGDERPLATNEADARVLYAERSNFYSFADVRIEVLPTESSAEIAGKIVKLTRAA